MIDIVFLLMMAVFIFCGSKRGLIKSSMGLISTAVSIVAGLLLMKPVSELLSFSGISETAETAAMKWFEKNEVSQMPLPDFMLGGIYETASTAFSQLVINALSFIVVIILVKMVMGILANVVGAIFKLPLLKQANALLGAVMGGICGVVFSYLIVGVTAVFAPLCQADALTKILDDSLFLSDWFNNNILINSFMNF